MTDKLRVKLEFLTIFSAVALGALHSIEGKDLAVTVYNSDIALVHDTRRMALKQGASELRFADAYSDSSAKRLEGRLDYATFNSNIGMGNWQLNVTFKGSDLTPFTINTTYPFSTNFVGGVACNQVAAALPAAVQDLIGKLVEHPSFKEFAARTN